MNLETYGSIEATIVDDDLRICDQNAVVEIDVVFGGSREIIVVEDGDQNGFTTSQSTITGLLPGSYTAIVKDKSEQCDSMELPFTISEYCPGCDEQSIPSSQYGHQSCSVSSEPIQPDQVYVHNE